MKAIITVLGKDKVGIIAKTCVYLAERQVNVLDISQTIIDDGFFNMVMAVDITNMTCSFEELVSGAEEVGREIGVVVRCQREEIFESMHRI